MKNKFIGLIIILALLSIYPAWRYFNNAKVFAQALFDDASGLGSWTNRSINTTFNGEITVRGVYISPQGYTQGLEMDSIVIKTDPMFLLKNSADDLKYALPPSLTISMNHIVLNERSDDIEETLHNRNLWMLMLGFGGSFGCDTDSFTTFKYKDWHKIFSDKQIFNVDLFYTRLDDGTLDVDLTLDAEGLFSSTWSSNLKSGVMGQQIALEDLVVDKLYYSYLDNGFNLNRNNVCKRHHNNSLSHYKTAAVANIQEYLRIHTNKELSELLLEKYQRLLTPEVEFNAIITLKNRDYLSSIYQMSQERFLGNAFVEIANNSNDYLPITLKEIDVSKYAQEQLLKEQQKRQDLAKQKETQVIEQQKRKSLPKIYTTGKKHSRKIPVASLSNYINRKVRIKTDRGRPVTGYITAVTATTITIETKFKTGNASLQLDTNRISSAESMR